MEKRKVLYAILAGMFLILAGVAAYHIVSKDVGDLRDQQTYDDIAKQAFTVEVPAENNEESTEPMGTNTSDVPNFKSLKETNEYCVGWIQMQGSVINYPVVWRSFDTQYFLKHLFNGAYGNAGTLYISDECDPHFGSQNTIIFGHNMFNGSMFAPIERFKYQAYANDHKELVYYSDEEKKYILAPFAGFYTTGSDDYLYVNFESGEAFLRYVNDKIMRSTFTSNVKINETDKIVTLSTCSYNIDDGRYVLYCKLYEYEN